MLKNLILDWSGTIVDDLPPTLEATNAVLASYGLPTMDRDEFRERFRLPYSEFYHELLPGEPMDVLEAKYQKAFLAAEEKVSLLDGARGFLETCEAAGVRLFLLSSIREDHFERHAADFGVRHHFEDTYAGVRDKREAMATILEKHHLLPEETAYVGDMEHDVAAARAGGVAAIAVRSGYDTATTLATAEPDLLLADVAALGDLLTARPKERPIPTVGALIFDAADRVLLVQTHKWSDKWGIPGGKIRRGETAESALVREIREETALEIADVEFVCVQDAIDPEEFFRPAHFILLNYTVRTTSDPASVVLNDEAEDFRWLPLDECDSLNLNIPTRVLVNQVRARSNA